MNFWAVTTNDISNIFISDVKITSDIREVATKLSPNSKELCLL